MSHFVYQIRDGQFVGTRKLIAPRTARVTYVSDLQQARIFTSAGAASRAGDGSGKPLPVTVKLTPTLA